MKQFPVSNFFVTTHSSGPLCCVRFSLHHMGLSFLQFSSSSESHNLIRAHHCSRKMLYFLLVFLQWSLLFCLTFLLQFLFTPFFSLIYSILTPSFAPLPSVSSKGDPMKVFNCSEMPTVSWTKWLSRLVSWHESLIHFSSSLFAVIQKLSVSGESWTHSQTHFISLFFDSSRLYIIEAVKMSD